MIPGSQHHLDDQTPSMTEATPAPFTDAIDVQEERVVLAPPEGVSLTETARIADIAKDIARSHESPPRRSVPIWVIAAALIGGASIALSAQAVMRRPTRTTMANAPTQAAATTSAATLRPIGPSPIVAPSTVATPVVALLPQAQATTTPLVRWVMTPDRPHRERNAGSTTRSNPGSRIRKRGSAAKWVDPFATTRPTMTASPNAKKAPDATASPNAKRAPDATASPTSWVDPFAN